MARNNYSKKSTRTKWLLIAALALIIAILIAVTVIVALHINKITSVPTKIMVSDFPKLTYFVGEEADLSGLSLHITKQNGKTEQVRYTEENAADFSFTGFDSTRPYDGQKITITYMGLTCSYYISVKEVPKPTATLVAISIDVMPKTEYKVGEWLNTDGGMLLKHYSDGTTERTIIVNNYIESGWREAREGGPGTYTLTIKYEEKGSKTMRTTYDITITE